MKYVNLTPHPVVVVRGTEKVTIPPSGMVARVSEARQSAGSVDGIPLVRIVRGVVEGLPAPEDGTIYIVSALVLSACGGRTDVVAPDTGAGAVRDAQGRIIGTTGFVVP